MVSDCCAKLGPLVVGSDYKPRGTSKITANGLAYYEVEIGEKKAKDVAIIGIYDVMGITYPQTLQQFDRVSEALGVKVVCPDVFGNGADYRAAGTDDASRENVRDWVDRHCSFEDAKSKIIDLRETLSAEGITKFGIFGYCYGGIVAELAAHYPPPNNFLAAGSVHGATFTPENAVGVNCPFINLASKSEGDPKPYIDVLPEGIKEKSEYKHFVDVPHGFASSRGDWTDPVKRENAKESVEMIAAFMEKHVVGSH